jgi:hypothetical protein
LLPTRPFPPEGLDTSAFVIIGIVILGRDPRIVQASRDLSERSDPLPDPRVEH